MLSPTILPPGVSRRVQDSSLCPVWGALSMLHRKVEDLDSGFPQSTQWEFEERGLASGVLGAEMQFTGQVHGC